MKEKRSCPRISINTHCIVFIETKESIYETEGIVRDFSDGGLCISIENSPNNEKLIEQSEELRVSFRGPASTSMEKADFSFSFLKKWILKEENAIRIGGTYELL